MMLVSNSASRFSTVKHPEHLAHSDLILINAVPKQSKPWRDNVVSNSSRLGAHNNFHSTIRADIHSAVPKDRVTITTTFNRAVRVRRSLKALGNIRAICPPQREDQ